MNHPIRFVLFLGNNKNQGTLDTYLYLDYTHYINISNFLQPEYLIISIFEKYIYILCDITFCKHPVLTKLQQKKMRVDSSNGSDGKRKSDFF